MDVDGEHIPPGDFERFLREYHDVIARAYVTEASLAVLSKEAKRLLEVGRNGSRIRAWLRRWLRVRRRLGELAARRRKYRYLVYVLGFPREEAAERARWP